MATDPDVPSSARETLALFVAGGNLLSTEPSPRVPPARGKLIRERQRAILAGGKVNPEAGPSELREALEEQIQAADDRERKSRGVDLPRNAKWANHPIMKHIYRAHDAVAMLPVPGGLALIIVAIFIFWLFLIPVSSKGETRANLLWDVVLGQKSLPPATVAGAGNATVVTDAHSQIRADILSKLGVDPSKLTSDQVLLINQQITYAEQTLPNGTGTPVQIEAVALPLVQAYLNGLGIATPGATPTGSGGMPTSPAEFSYYPLEG
jgi:hypothetical protein